MAQQGQRGFVNCKGIEVPPNLRFDVGEKIKRKIKNSPNWLCEIPIIYKEVSMTSDKKGFYVQNEQKNNGYCNDEGKLVIPIEYAFLHKYKYKDFFKYKKSTRSNHYGLISSDLNIKIAAVYDDISPFENGYALVVKNGKRGYINEKGLEFFKK